MSDSQHNDRLEAAGSDGWKARLRLPRVRVLFGLFLALLLVLGPFIYRGYHISRIPYVPEPFDFDEFRNRSVPDSRNALVEYSKMLNDPVLSESPYDEPDVANPDTTDGERFFALLDGDYAGASERQREWVTRCEETLDIWFAGTLKPQLGRQQLSEEERGLVWSSAEEIRNACRARIGRELFHENGVEAVRWSLALFRFSRQLTHTAGWGERLAAFESHDVAAAALNEVLNRSDLSAESVEQLTEDVVSEYQTLTSPLSETLRMACLNNDRFLSTDEWRDYLPAGDDFRTRLELWLLGEPEVSQRYSRAMTVNVLQHLDEPMLKRPPVLPCWAFDIPARSPDELSGTALQSLEQNAVLRRLFLIGSDASLATVIDVERLEQSLLTAALHVHVFSRRHGRLPKSIDECVPEHLRHEVVDPYSPTGDAVGFINEGVRVIVYSKVNSTDDVANFVADRYGRLWSDVGDGRGFQIVMPGDLESFRPVD